jgi:hypothetical protein
MGKTAIKVHIGIQGTQAMTGPSFVWEEREK